MRHTCTVMLNTNTACTNEKEPHIFLAENKQWVKISETLITCRVSLMMLGGNFEMSIDKIFFTNDNIRWRPTLHTAEPLAATFSSLLTACSRVGTGTHWSSFHR